MVIASERTECSGAAQMLAARPIAEAEDIARGAVYLASDDSSFITGSHMIVDGGQKTVFSTGAVFGYTD
jgi:NAD(P)-dependent dehydrogenase (short-subunit alcohol dehydrogenase family)